MTMRVLIVEPGKAPEVAEIIGTLESMQAVVSGTIQAIYPFDEAVALICNDDGKLLGLPLNRALRDEGGHIYDVVAGTFFLCAAPADSESFVSLTDEQVEKYRAMFRDPELFLQTRDGLLCLQVSQ